MYLDVAAMLDSDWVSLARHLGIGDREVMRIQLNNASMIEQARGILRHWACSNAHPDPRELERALRYIGREDIIDKFFLESIVVTEGSEAHDNSTQNFMSITGSYEMISPLTRKGQKSLTIAQLSICVTK